MKKIFRMAKAELGKIFMRPSMFILATVLIIALVLSFFFFSPSPKSGKTKLPFVSQSAVTMFNDFEKKAKEEIDVELLSAKADIEKFLDKENDTFNMFKDKTSKLCSAYDTFCRDVLTYYDSTKDFKKALDAFTNFRSVVLEYKDDVLDEKINGQYVNFFITISEFENIDKVIKNLLQTLPTQNQVENFNTQSVLDRLNVISASFGAELSNIDNLVNNKIEKIEIDSSELEKLLNKYYTPNITELEDGYKRSGTLKKLYSDIESCYHEIISSNSENNADYILSEKIAHYYDYIQICKTLISNNFELLRIGNKSDDEIVNYNGFSGVSIYNLKLEITTSKYFYDLNNDENEGNDSFGYEYLNVFNFNTNSGTETNAYDFTFFAMQILSSLIILFVIFFAGSAITGEQNSGTLKMTAIRPYSRNKIFSGKFLACFNVAFILLVVSFIASFVVGFASFGLPTQNVLVVMNASDVFIAHPMLVMLIYLASLVIDILFYIVIAILISMLIKPTTINTAVSASIFIISTIINGSIYSSWIRFIPTNHLGLFKFFTNSNTAMFSYSIVPGVNFLISGAIVLVCIVMFDLIGRMLFARKSIDK